MLKGAALLSSTYLNTTTPAIIIDVELPWLQSIAAGGGTHLGTWHSDNQARWAR